MVLLNAVRLLLENFKNTYKLLLCKLVVTLVASALCCAMILPELFTLAESAPALQLVAGVKSFLSAFFAVDTAGIGAARTEILNAVKGFGELLAQRATGMVLATVGCVVVYLLKRFADTVCHYAVGNILNDKMKTYGETPLLSSLVSNLGKASIYSVAYVLVAFVCDLLTFGLVWLICSVTGIVLSLFLSMTAIVVMQAIKFTATGLWMPAMTADNKTLKGAFHVGTQPERKQRVKMFAAYIEAVYAIIIINVVAAFCTFGSALILTLPASYFLLICLQYVYYYTVQGKNYFISFDRIASNPDHGDREHIFNYINETQLPVIAETAEEQKKDNTKAEK